MFGEDEEAAAKLFSSHHSDVASHARSGNSKSTTNRFVVEFNKEYCRERNCHDIMQELPGVGTGRYEIVGTSLGLITTDWDTLSALQEEKSSHEHGGMLKEFIVFHPSLKIEENVHSMEKQSDKEECQIEKNENGWKDHIAKSSI